MLSSAILSLSVFMQLVNVERGDCFFTFLDLLTQHEPRTQRLSMASRRLRRASSQTVSVSMRPVHAAAIFDSLF